MPKYIYKDIRQIIDFRPDEKVLFVIHRHMAVLVTRLLPAVILFVFVAAIVGYRGMGGQVITANTGYSNQMFDTFNIILFIGLLLIFGYMSYTYLDWARDHLILTNQRLIRDLDQPLIRHIQEQLPIDDIQSVEARTQSYVGHWLNLGYVKVQSASFNKALFFPGAYDPGAMQAQIMEQVNQREQETEDAEFARLIEKRVYHDASGEVKPTQTIRHSYTPHTLAWLFPMNPEFDPEKGTYTWRRHWFFLVETLLLPVLIFLIGLGLLAVAAGMQFIGGGVLLAFLLPLVLICGGWAAWQIQDHRNDRYILTPAQVVDIAKRPLGPETRQSAGLEALQNITYKTTFFGRIFGFGNVLLETAGPGEGLTFYALPNPREVVATIDTYQATYNQSQKERSMEDTLKLLRFYHMAQEQRERTAGAAPPPPPNAADQPTS